MFAFLLSCGSLEPESNINLPLPQALTKAQAAGDLEARLVATNGKETKSVLLTIDGGMVTGTLLLKSGDWTMELQFFQMAASGNLIPIAFISFGPREVNKKGITLDYLPTDIRFNESPSEGIFAAVSPAESVPASCVSKFDCDGDSYNNFEEMKAGSNPEDANSRPVEKVVELPPPPPPPPPPSCGDKTIDKGEECDDGNTTAGDGCNASCNKEPPVIAVTINDKTISDSTTMVQGIVKIAAISSSPFASPVTLASVEVKGLGLEQGSLLSDGNSLPQAFDVSWDTKAIEGGEDQDYILTFTAQDVEKRETVKTCKVKVDNVPNILAFGTDRLIQAGQAADLNWDVNNFTSLSIDNGVGDVTNLTRVSVIPAATTTFRLTATRRGTVKTFSITRDVTITVNHPPAFARHTTADTGQDPKASGGVRISFDRSDEDSDTVSSTVTLYKGISCAGNHVSTQTTTGGSINVIGLDPRTDYSYTVSLSDGRGGNASGACRSFTTADTGLVGWWRFDEGSGTTAADSSGNNNAGTLTAAAPDDDRIGANGLPPTWTTEVSGSALSLDGVDDYVDMGSSTIFNFGDSVTDTPFSFLAWIKGGSMSPSGNILQKYISQAGQQQYIFYTSDGNLGIMIDDTSGDDRKEISTILNPLNDTDWHMVTATYDGSGTVSGLRLYIDGLLVGTTVINDVLDYVAMEVTGTPLKIGDTFNGLIDEVAIYNRALSAREIRQNCSRISDTICDGLTPVPVNPIDGSAFVPKSDGTFDPIEWTTADDATYIVRIWRLPTATAAMSAGTALHTGDGFNAGSATSSSAISGFPTLDYRTDYAWEVTACAVSNPTNCVTGGPWRFTTTHQGLVGWWRMDEGIGTTVADSSGAGHDLELQTGLNQQGNETTPIPTWETGLPSGSLDQALYFDGTGNHLRTDSTVDLGFGNTWAISFWVKLASSGGNLQTFFSIGNMSGIYDGVAINEGDVSRDYLMARTMNGKRNIEVRYRGDNASLSELYFFTPNEVLTAGTWQYITLTHSGGTDLSTFKIFVDGVKQQITSDLPITTVPAQAISGSRRLLIGRDLDLAHKQCGIDRDGDHISDQECALYGRLDDFALYNRALSTQEIRDNCQRNLPSGATCSADDTPDQVTPSGTPTAILPPTRAFLSWKPGTVPSEKAIHHYELCYTTTGRDLTPRRACDIPVDTTVPYHVIDPLTANNTGYRWKVKTCYNAAGTDCSAYSPVWSFSTDDSLVGWWKFDEENGVSAVDSSGRGRGGTLNGPDELTHTTGILNYAISLNDISLDGIADYVSSDTVEIPQNGPATLEGWFYFRKKLNPADNFVQLFAGVLYQHTSNNYLYINGTGVSFIWEPKLNRWYHLALTYSGDSSTARLYVDGEVKITNQEENTNPQTDSPYPVPSLSGIVSSSSRPFNGLVDEVSFIDSALSAETIKNNYCAVEALAGTSPLPEVCR